MFPKDEVKKNINSAITKSALLVATEFPMLNDKAILKILSIYKSCLLEEFGLED